MPGADGRDTVHGNLKHAMRENYNEHGVDEVCMYLRPALKLSRFRSCSRSGQYYRKVAASYRNPFFPGIKKVRDCIQLTAQATTDADRW